MVPSAELVFGGIVVIVFTAIVSSFSRDTLWYALVFFGAIYLLIVGRGWYAKVWWRMTSTILVAAACAALGGGLWHLLVLPRLASPEAKSDIDQAPPIAGGLSDIDWKFERPEAPVPFLGLASSFGEEPYVYLFQFHAKNNLNERLTNLSGYIQSRSSDTRLPVGINVGGTIVDFSAVDGVPANADFEIMTWPLPSNVAHRTGGMTVSKFLVEFAECVFVFNYNGRQYTRVFTNTEVLQPIEKFARERAEEAAKRTPRVQLREETNGKTK